MSAEGRKDGKMIVSREMKSERGRYGGLWLPSEHERRK